jgi:hypothetical protein
MREPAASDKNPGPAARESAALVSWSWRAPSPRVRRGKSRPAFPSLGGSGVYVVRALPDLCLGIVSGRLEAHSL